MTHPKRIQLRRTKGWKKPEGAVVVSRPSIWGNPFKIRDSVRSDSGEWTLIESAEQAVAAFKEMLTKSPRNYNENIDQLRGKDLCCWCALDQPCHADVLLEIANA